MTKKIKKLNIDTSDLNSKGENRLFNITGQKGAGFFLFVKRENGNYYNFTTLKFQATGEPYLKGEIYGNGYRGNILFPSLSSGTGNEYTIYLITDISLNSSHDKYIEVRKEDGSIDVNASVGSNSNMLTKVIFQQATTTLTIDSLAIGGGSGFTGMSDVTDTIVSNFGDSVPLTPFRISVTAQNGRAFTLQRQPNSKDFVSTIEDVTMGAFEPVQVSGDGADSRFQWNVDKAANITNGMYVTGTNVAANTMVSDQVEEITSLVGTAKETKYTKVSEKGVQKVGKVSISRDNTTKVETTSYAGLVTFNIGQADALAGDTDVIFYGYGEQNINSISGWDISITHLKAEITPVTTTTTGAVNASATVPVTSGHGIMDGGVSVLTSNNTSKATEPPSVTTIGSYVVGSAATATLTMNTAQTLESGETLTFAGAGSTITITGLIDVKQAGPSGSIYLDVNRFITATVETA